MKKFLLLFVPVMIITGCSREIDYPKPPTEADIEETMPEVRTRSLEGAIYNEVTDAWMIPQKDPYALANFQKAYDDLASGKSTQILTKTQAAEFSVTKKLEPTHYALMIYPRTEEEQWRIETMNDVDVRYIPLDYVQLTQEEIEKLSRSKTRSAADIFPEKSPYTVTYDNYESTDGGPTGTFQLPILYAVWPVTKPLPEDMEYVMDYEVFLPSAAKTHDMTPMRVLENEAISSALGITARTLPQTDATRASAVPMLELTGYLQVYDDILKRDIPLGNVDVLYRLGSNWMTAYASAGGSFTIQTDIPASESTYMEWFNTNLTISYRDVSGRYRITSESSTVVYQISVNANFPVGRNNTLYGPLRITLPAGNRQANEIHRAADYYYNKQTDFSRPVPSGGLRIIADSHSNMSPDGTSYTNGMFSVPSSGNPWITIWNNGKRDGEVIGTSLHEIGHYFHFSLNNNRYRNTHNFLRESFAEYVGWYEGEAYYLSKGWIKPYSSYDITTCAAQSWWKTDAGNLSWYSPLFVDLTDDYNQRLWGTYYPNDELINLHPGAIWHIIENSTSWTQCRQLISQYASPQFTNYTLAQFEEYIKDFDYWFTHN